VELCSVGLIGWLGLTLIELENFAKMAQFIVTALLTALLMAFLNNVFHWRGNLVLVCQIIGKIIRVLAFDMSDESSCAYNICF